MTMSAQERIVPSALADPLFTTHYSVRAGISGLVIPPYTSLYDKVKQHQALVKRAERTRSNALFSLRLHAGQTQPPNGSVGRNALPPLPESLSGAIYSTSI